MKAWRLTLISCFTFLSFQAHCQSIDIKERLSSEIDALIIYCHDFLGKSEHEILSMDKLNYMVFGKSWNVKAYTPNNVSEYSRFFSIETGSGGVITIYISSKSKLSYFISYTPLSWMTYSELNNILTNERRIESNGYSKPIELYNDTKYRIGLNLNMSDSGAPELRIFGLTFPENKIKYFEKLSR